MSTTEIASRESPPNSSYCRQAFESKWMNIALVVGILGFLIIIGLVATGHFDFIGTTGVNCVKYTGSVVNAILCLIGIKKLHRCCKKTAIESKYKQSRIQQHSQKKQDFLGKFISLQTELIENIPLVGDITNPLNKDEVAQMRQAADTYVETSFEDFPPNPLFSQIEQVKEKEELKKNVAGAKRIMDDFISKLASQHDPVVFFMQCETSQIDSDILRFFKEILSSMRSFPKD